MKKCSLTKEIPPMRILSRRKIVWKEIPSDEKEHFFQIAIFSRGEYFDKQI